MIALGRLALRRTRTRFLAAVVPPTTVEVTPRPATVAMVRPRPATLAALSERVTTAVVTAHDTTPVLTHG